MEVRFDPSLNLLSVRAMHFKGLTKALKMLSRDYPDISSVVSGINIMTSQSATQYLDAILKWHSNPSLILWVVFSSANVSLETLKLLPKNTKVLILDALVSSPDVFLGLDGHKKVSTLSLNKMRSISLGALKKLPPLTQIREINMGSCTLDRIGSSYSQTCEYLPEFPNLRKLSLVNCGVLDSDLSHLGTCNSLMHLDLSYNSGIGNGLCDIYGMKELEILILKGCNIIRADDLSYISETPKLRVLNLMYNPSLNDRSFYDISEIETLEVLKISGINLSFDSLCRLLRNPGIRKLHFVDCKLPSQFGDLISCSFLEELSVKGSDLQTEMLTRILECTTIKILNIKNTPASQNKGEHFKKLRSKMYVKTFMF